MSTDPRPRRARHTILAAASAIALLGAVLTTPASASTQQTSVSRSVAASPTQILGYYNGLRAANGIPGDLTLDSAHSSDCQLEDHYAAVNGYDTPNPHHETPGKPGYTTGGDWAAHNSELAGGSTLVSVFAPFDRGVPLWSAPFTLAPFHLMGLLNPNNTALWGADSEGELCIGEAGSRPAPAADTLNSFPGSGSSVPWAEPYPDEYPTSPEAVAGIPSGTVTGPALIAYWRGPSSDADPPLDELASAGLAGPHGSVAVALVGQQQSDLVPSGAGFIIPRSPLTPGAHYTATVTFSNADLAALDGVPARNFTTTFSFTAAGPASPASLVHITAVGQPHHRVTFVTAADFPAAGRSAKLTVTSSNPLLRIGGGYGYLPGVDSLSLYPLSAPPPGGWLRLSYKVSSYTVGGVSIPGTTISKKISGPPLSTLLTGLRPRRSYSARSADRPGIRLSGRVKQAGTQLQAALQRGHTLYAVSRHVRVRRSGRVSLVLSASSGLLDALLGHHRSMTLTLALRIAAPGYQQFEIDRRVRITS